VTDTEDRLLATVALHPHDETMREIGFWAAPWARRLGVTTAATRLACRWGFEELGLERVEWWAAVGNWGSRRVVERLGFTVEGTCRGRLLHRGVRTDAWVGGMLAGELR
jgi:RimJ/RimL family protein N-acetyltransferase